MKLRLFFSIFLLSFAASAEDYGTPYTIDDKPREAAAWQVTAAYAFDVADSFIRHDTLQINAQRRVFAFISTGLLSQLSWPQSTDAGRSVKQLEQSADIQSSIQALQWSIFSHTQVQFFVGRFNFFNWAEVESELIGGGGFGWIHSKLDIYGSKTQTDLSYLWSLEQRFWVSEHVGLSFSFLSHRDAYFVSSGLSARLF